MKKNNLKSQTPLPFFGNFLNVIIDGLRNYDIKIMKKYGKTCAVFEFYKPVVFTVDTKFIKTVLIKDFGHFVNRV